MDLDQAEDEKAQEGKQMKYKDVGCPCYGCEDRCVNCHASCEEYKIYEKTKHEMNELRIQRNKGESMMYAIRERNLRRADKKRR